MTTYPNYTLKGVEFDLYDLAPALDIESHILFGAFKKIIRRGQGEKTERRDLEEAINAIQRYLRELKEEAP